MKRRGRVGIFVVYYPFGTTTQVVNAATLLAQNGYQVDVFLFGAVGKDLVDFGDMPVTVYDVQPPESQGASGNSKERLRAFLACLRLTGIGQWLWRSFNTARWHWRAHLGLRPEYLLIPQVIIDQIRACMTHHPEEYRCLIAVEGRALVLAGLLGQELNVPYLYYSLELYTSDGPEYSGAEFQLLKQLERRYHQGSTATLIQTPERARILCEDNRIPDARVFYLPVSLLGDSMTTKSTYLHRLLGVAPATKIILYAGYVHHADLLLELVQASQTLPESWLLVVHGFTHANLEFSQRFVDRFASANTQGRATLSNTIVPQEAVSELVASAHIGLALYEDISANFTSIAFASEKLARYYQCGVPVVVNDLPSLRQMIAESKGGQCVSKASDFLDAVHVIDQDYDRYRANALAGYERFYRFDHHFQPVVGSIDSLEAAEARPFVGSIL
ncbi:MAG: hypothetical protein KDI55_08420 [Anaerolineae bacterium]|nr:hypothetical protein [Anaerolineae bacterium]